MPSIISPTERWFVNLEKLQGCMKNLNHLTDDSLKGFSKQTLSSLITSDLIKGNLIMCCENKGIGEVPDSAFDDMSKNFFSFLDMASKISIKASLRSQIFSVAVRHKPELITVPTATVMKMSLNDVFGQEPLSSNIGKKELDLVLNQITPDEFYPIDGSFLTTGTDSLDRIVKKITG